jgi:hypothetical protein
MSGRHGHKKKPKTRNPSGGVTSGHDSICQEHPDAKKEGDVESTQSNPPPPLTIFTIQNAAILTPTLISILALVAYFTQACYMRQAMRLDQRAWVGVSNPVTENNVLDTKNRVISFGKLSVILRNSGKTPALKVDWTCCIFKELTPTDPTPDYDAIMADQYRRQAMNKGSQIDKENTLYEGLVSHKGEVYAPGTERLTVLMNGTTGSPWPSVQYVLGKMTYQDVFTATRRTTKFCLQNSGSGFSFCREGNWMD